jgi:lysophospholipase L1-like esterase
MGVRRAWLANLLVALVATALALGMAEGIIRLFVPDMRQEYSVAPTGDPFKFYRFDEQLGWSNAPLMTGTFRRADFEYPVRINRFGMRQKDVTLEKRPGVFRIAFMGDSFVWGIGVAEEERFTERVGALPGIEALNFGVSGYGPLQQYLLLDKVKTFSPDLVVLVFCLNNDFDDNVFYERYGYYKPYAVLDSAGEIQIKGYPLPNVRKFGYRTTWAAGGLLGRSRLVSATLGALAGLSNASRSSGQAGLIGFSNLALYRYPRLGPKRLRLTGEAVRINKEILRRIREDLARDSIPMVLVPAPTRYEYHPQGGYGDVTRNQAVSDILKATAAELGVDFVDTVPRLNGRDFWERDGHWNLRGHEKMAQAVTEYLQSRGVVRPSPPR